MPTYPANRIESQLNVPYERFTRAFESLLGRTDVDVFARLPAMPAEELHTRLQSVVGPLDFSLFQKIDHGGILTALTPRHVRAMTYVFGNALIAMTMTQHDPRAGLYVPLRLFVTEADAGVLVTYDLPSALMAQFGNAAITLVARDLDAKVERLLRETEKKARES